MITVDASALVNALLDDGAVGSACRRVLADDPHWVAPEILVVETVSAIRGRLLGGKVSSARAEDAVDALALVALDVVPTAQILGRIWQLRSALSAYDAAYVAVAGAHDCPLVTVDARLAKPGAVGCEIRVVSGLARG